MLFTIGLILLIGFVLGKLFNKMKLPSLIGMILGGIILSSLNLLDDVTLTIAPDLRKIALVIILTRAGLSLNVSDLKKSGKPALLMCFLPATFEILGCMLILPKLLGLSLLESVLAGSVISAVSPAVVVPRMIHCIENNYGTKKGIPQMVLAGASADDVYVIVIFTSLCKSVQHGDFSLISMLKVPISAILGIGLGVLCGYLFTKLFDNFHLKDTEKIILILSISFFILKLEDVLTGLISISGLLSIMSMNMTICKIQPDRAKRLSIRFNKIWSMAEILLFVLVGSSVDISHIKSIGLIAVGCILIALVFRMCGVFLCMLNTKLSNKEKLFCMISYCPKATVQAGIGAVPLAMGLACGDMVLTLAVVSILVTAPLGAILIDNLYKKLLSKDID